MTDRELADRIRAGDRDAAAALVRAYYASVLRFLWLLSRNADDADELTQETFLRALTKISHFRGESGLRTWLHKIAYHAFTHRRRQRRVLPLSTEICSRPFESASAMGVDLERALAELPETARAAFVLCEIQELSVREAALVLRLPEGTVKSRVHTARQGLRSSLRSHNDSQGQQEVDCAV